MAHFEKDPYPSRSTKESLAQELGLTFNQVLTAALKDFVMHVNWVSRLILVSSNRSVNGFLLSVIIQEVLLPRTKNIREKILP